LYDFRSYIEGRTIVFPFLPLPIQAARTARGPARPSFLTPELAERLGNALQEIILTHPIARPYVRIETDEDTPDLEHIYGELLACSYHSTSELYHQVHQACSDPFRAGVLIAAEVERLIQRAFRRIIPLSCQEWGKRYAKLYDKLESLSLERPQSLQGYSSVTAGLFQCSDTFRPFTGEELRAAMDYERDKRIRSGCQQLPFLPVAFSPDWVYDNSRQIDNSIGDDGFFEILRRPSHIQPLPVIERPQPTFPKYPDLPMEESQKIGPGGARKTPRQLHGPTSKSPAQSRLKLRSRVTNSKSNADSDEDDEDDRLPEIKKSKSRSLPGRDVDISESDRSAFIEAVQHLTSNADVRAFCSILASEANLDPSDAVLEVHLETLRPHTMHELIKYAKKRLLSLGQPYPR
jgi:hypothetical protein